MGNKKRKRKERKERKKKYFWKIISRELPFGWKQTKGHISRCIGEERRGERGRMVSNEGVWSGEKERKKERKREREKERKKENQQLIVNKKGSHFLGGLVLTFQALLGYRSQFVVRMDDQ